MASGVRLFQIPENYVVTE